MNQLVEDSVKDGGFASRLKDRAKKHFRQKSKCEVSLAKFKVRALVPEGIPVLAMNTDTSQVAVDEAFTTPGSLQGKNKPDTLLSVCLKDGVRVKSRKGKAICHYSIHEVGYCNVDSRYPEIVVFIATGSESCLRCHAFICEDAKRASEICLTLARTFQNGYELWKKSKDTAVDSFAKPSKSTDDFLTLSKYELEPRKSEHIDTNPNKKHDKRLRRNTDFEGKRPTRASRKLRLGSVSSSTDCLAEIFDDEANKAWELVSASAERGECPLLEKQYKDWQDSDETDDEKTKASGALLWSETS